MAGSQFDGVRPGAIGQRQRGQNNGGAAVGTSLSSGLSNSFTGGSQLSSIFGGAGLTLPPAHASAQINGSNSLNRGSLNGSSTASDNYDELFELEHDVPVRSRGTTNGMNNNPAAPNPQFISMEGFAQRFSGMTTFSHADSSSSINAAKPKNINMPPIPSASALSRPSA
ncbi:hypothetical protein EV175_005851 [Coemansia sp. RSA 1933]|nr:hypothetical protein EV175_005851 [Coemansia sp. RSA 1933]